MTQRDRDRRLATLWNQGYQVSVIAARLGYNHGSSVSHAAKRLGLQARRRQPDTSAATLAARRARQVRQVRGEAEMLANLAKAVMRPVGPIPSLWRCDWCGGVSVGAERHPQCREVA